MQRRLQPFARAHFALIAKAVRVGPSSSLHQQLHGFFDLSLVRIPFFNDRHRNAVRAEDDLGALRIRKTREGFIYLFGQRIEIVRMPVKSLHAMHRQIIVKTSLPFIQAGAGSGGGILRIKRKKHDLIALSSAQLRDRFARKGMPLAHRDEAVRINALAAQLAFQRSRLALGVGANGRPTADSGVVMLHFAGTRG